LLIRIRRPVAGILDGVSLSHFVRGPCYHVTESLGGYLVSIGVAEIVLSSTQAQIVPMEELTDTPVFSGAVVVPPNNVSSAVVVPPDIAADRPPRRRPVKRRRKRR
jgi:hypothetical protein